MVARLLHVLDADAMTKLIALAGPSRSGKGTAARIIAEECVKLGLTSLERQLSDNGKWSLARIFRPTIGRVEAVAWFEALKGDDVRVSIEGYNSGEFARVPLQKFLQHGLQEGGRDIFGEDLWTDRIIALAVDGDVFSSQRRGDRDQPAPSAWLDTFFDDESGVEPTDVAIISDLRQLNEARRVRDIGGLVVEMVRPEVDDQYRTGVAHITERRLPFELSHYEVANNGMIEDLENSIRLLFEIHLKPWITS